MQTTDADHRAGIRDRVVAALQLNSELRDRARLASTAQAELLNGIRTNRARVGEQARLLRELVPLTRQHRPPVRPAVIHRPQRPRPRRSGAGDWPAGVADIHREYSATRDPRLEEQLVAIYESFAVGLARRIGQRHERAEDLAQVARLGLLHAIRRYDPDLGRPFSVFARATIEGELKRHLRDRTWAMRVPRGLKERSIDLVKAGDDLRETLGRSPTVPELACHLSMTDEQVLEAMEAAGQRRLLSLDAPAGASGPTLDVGVTENMFAHIETRELLDQLLRRLSERDRELLRLRFVEELSQAEIADRIGMSQMNVSRRLSRTLGRLRTWAR